METTWDMSPAKRKMFIVAASFPSFVRARGTLLVAGFSCFSLDPQRLLFRKRGAGVDAVKMKDHHSSPRLSLVSRNRYGRGFCLLPSVLPAASEVRV